MKKKDYENFIYNHVLVDAYTEEEKVSWSIYIEDNLVFPFTAEFPVKKKDGHIEWSKGKIVSLLSTQKNYEGGAFLIEAEYNDILLPLDVLSLKHIKADPETLEVIEVWRYWNDK